MLTSSLMFEMTKGFVSSAISMIRAAPILSPLPNSSISIRNLCPLMVTGIVTWGVLLVGQSRVLTTLT